jgi:hypothetical protein
MQTKLINNALKIPSVATPGPVLCRGDVLSVFFIQEGDIMGRKKSRTLEEWRKEIEKEMQQPGMKEAKQELDRLRNMAEPMLKQGFNLARWLHIMVEEVEKSERKLSNEELGNLVALRESEYWPNRPQARPITEKV